MIRLNEMELENIPKFSHFFQHPEECLRRAGSGEKIVYSWNGMLQKRILNVLKVIE